MGAILLECAFSDGLFQGERFHWISTFVLVREPSLQKQTGSGFAGGLWLIASAQLILWSLGEKSVCVCFVT